MKRFVSFVLTALVMLAMMTAACAEELSYSVILLPEIYESEDALSIAVEKIIPVGLRWDNVYHEETISTYAIVPHENNIFAVLLTDGCHFVHGQMEEIADGLLIVSFKTEEIRTFLSKGAYMVFVGVIE